MKKIYSLVIGAAFLIGGSWGVYSYANLSKESLSDATLENIEALTDDIDGEGNKKYVLRSDGGPCIYYDQYGSHLGRLTICYEDSSGGPCASGCLRPM